MKNQLCEFCKSEISSDCYVCPVCKRSVNIYRFRKDNPYLKRFLILIFLFLFFTFVPRIIGESYFRGKYGFNGAVSHKLEVVSHKLIKTHEEVYILGEIKNNGKETFSYIEMEADLYDKKSNLIDVERDSIFGGFKPGETRAFKIVRCCKKDGIELGEFDRYEIKIVNGIRANE